MQIQMCNENGDLKILKIVENLNTLQHEKISALRGNSSREIIFGGPFICVLDNISRSIHSYDLFIGLLYFDILL